MPDMSAQSLLNFLQKYAANGRQVAVRQPRGYRMESWTYARISEEANRTARELEHRGISKGDSVLLWGTNSAEWIIAFMGCVLCGAVVVPIDHAATCEFAEKVAQEVNAKFVFHSESVAERLNLPSISLEGMTAAIAAHDTTPYSSPSLTREDALEIIFTSGTTAEPRGVIISHGNVLANIEPLQPEIQKYLKYEKFFHPIRFLNLLPLSHVFGQILGVFIPPILAGTVVFVDSLRPADFVETIHRERISVVVTVPRFMESLQREIEQYEESRGTLERFRRDFQAADGEHFLKRWWRFRRIRGRLGWKFWAFISGGAALPEQTETFWKRLGYAVVQGYGMTETTSLISLNHPFRATEGSIGKVFPGMEVRVDDSGEILVRGENVAKAYRRAGQVSSITESDGWFRTGDLAERDEQGNLYFKGRQKNVIVTSAGMNVYPEDLEKALRAQPGVRDCVVLGLERSGNETPYAVLLMYSAGSPENAATAAAAVNSANVHLAEYQRIRDWMVWPETDFPRTPTQKPILPRIRQAIAQKTGNAETSDANASESLTGLIARITGRPVEVTSKDANLETDLHLSSLDRVELMSVLEERHQVDLNEVQFQQAATVGQVENLLGQVAPATVQHVYPTWPQSALVTWIRMAIYYLLAWPATYLLAGPRIRGRDKLKAVKGPVLVVSNHVTYLDIAWILPALPWRLRSRLATAMGGERLARMRRPPATDNLWERFMERLRYFLVITLFNVFPLPQRSGFLHSFKFAGDLVDRGWNLLVFPEGKTTVDGNMIPFRSGVGLLAKQLNIPVLPMYLDGLFPLQQEKRIIAKPGTVTVTIGEPVNFAPDQNPNEIAAELERIVRALQSV